MPGNEPREVATMERCHDRDATLRDGNRPDKAVVGVDDVVSTGLHGPMEGPCGSKVQPSIVGSVERQDTDVEAEPTKVGDLFGDERAPPRLLGRSGTCS